MGHLCQLLYCHTNLFILDSLSHFIVRKIQIKLQKYFHQRQYSVHYHQFVSLFAFNLKLPAIITGTLSSVGQMIGPNSMLIAGMLIAAIP